MSILYALLRQSAERHKDATFLTEAKRTESFTTCKGKISITYSLKLDRSPALDEYLSNGGTPASLPHLTDSVKVEIAPLREKNASATVPVKDFADACGAEWPNDDNFERIAKVVRDKKAYRMPEKPIPGGGGKSLEAQGQTKKPGSHSQSKHR